MKIDRNRRCTLTKSSWRTACGHAVSVVCECLRERRARVLALVRVLRECKLQHVIEVD